MIGYHFTNGTLRDGSPVPKAGEWLRWDGPVVPCESGLHASESVLDALYYAPGATLHVVELLGDLQPHGNPVDKWVGRRRRIFTTIDADTLLRAFARWCALQVIHTWDAPDVVRDYLVTGDESLRDAARDTANAPAYAAASAPAYATAYATARATARAAAWAGASATARDAAWAGASATGGAAARAAAWAAAEDAQREQLAEMVRQRLLTME